jgi:plasmid stability protein
MPAALIRSVPDDVLNALKKRARVHRRSLQGELLALLEQASTDAADQSPAAIATRIRQALAAQGGTFTDSAPLIREDRER